MTSQTAITEMIGPVIAGYAPEDQRIFAALAERIAASRYRAWAEQVDDEGHRETLLACAAREEDIAARVEALRADAHELQAAMRHDHPDLPDLYVALFEGLPLSEQFALQAGAERNGAAAWRAFASQCDDPAQAEALRACAPLEEASAEALDRLIAELGAR